MFTGIVEETGAVESFERAADAWRLRVSARAARSGIARRARASPSMGAA